MTANAAHQTDPLARLGRQLISAAQVRTVRRRRRRTALSVSAATLALSCAIGVAALQTDVVVTVPPTHVRLFGQYRDARVNLRLVENDTTWRLVVYRTLAAGICIAAPTRTTRSLQMGCSSASLAADFDTSPLGTANAIHVTGAADRNTVIVYGIARPDVERLGVPSPSGETVERTIGGETLDVPMQQSEPHGDILTVRPFAVFGTAPPGAKWIPVMAYTSGGGGSVVNVRVQPALHKRKP